MKYYHVLLLINLFLSLLFVSNSYSQRNNEINLAENLVRSRNYESALQIFQKHYERGNLNNKVIRGISTCLTELGQNEELITFLKDVTYKAPEIFTYAIDLGRAYFLNDQPDSAFAVWQNVYLFEPAHLMRHRMVAQAMTSLRLFDEAIEVYLRALEKIPNQQVIHLDISTLYKAQLNYEKASEHYLIYYKKFEKQRNYVRSLLINMAKDDEAADRIIYSIVNFNDNDDPDLDELLANLYIRKKDYEKAFEIIVQIENNVSGNNFVYLTRFANEAAKDQSYEYVIKAYEYAIDKGDKQLKDVLRFNLAQAYYKSAMRFEKPDQTQAYENRIKKSLTILKELQNTTSARKYDAFELCADIYKEQYNDLDAAIEYYDKIKLNRIGSLKADNVRLKIADAFILKNNLSEAVKFYKQVKSKKYIALAQFNLAEVEYFTAQFKKSTAIYNAIIDRVGMRDSLANNAMSRKLQIDQFITDSLNFAKFSEAALLKRQKKYSEAAEKFSELYFNNNITSFQAGMDAVLLYNTIGKIEEANLILEDIVKSNPQEDQTDYAYLLLANNYRKQDKLSEAMVIYQQILVRFPTSFYSEQARQYAREINTLLQDRINN